MDQKEIIEDLSTNLRLVSIPTNNEEDLSQLMYIQGIIGKLPNFDEYAHENENFEPIEIQGKPLSEMVI